MRKTKGYAALFVIFLVSIEVLYYQYLPSGKISGLYGWFFEAVGNRYIILVVQGTATVLLEYFAVKHLVKNDCISLRYKNSHRLVMAGVREIWKVSAAVTGMLAGITFLVYLAGQGVSGLCFPDAGPLFLLGNLLLMDVTAGHLLLALMLGGIKENPSVCSVLMILVVNLGASASVFGMDSATARFTWIGNIMHMTLEDSYEVHFFYWGIWLLGSLALLYLKLFILWEKIIGKWRRKPLFIMSVILVTVMVFAVYGMFFRNYADVSGMHPVSDWFLYFIGFKKVDVFLLMYLFYHLPVWTGVYFFMTQFFSMYALQYLLRGKNMYCFYFKLLGRMAALTAGYYGTGLAVLGLSGLTLAGNAKDAVPITGNSVLLILNLLLQEWLLLLCMFGIWLINQEERHTGAAGIITLHLVLSGLAAKYLDAAAWLPLTGGVYLSHSSVQNVTFLVQGIFLAAAVLAVGFLLVYKYEKIFSRKKGDSIIW